MDQPRWLDFGWGDLGVAEAPGPGNNAKIVRYYAEVGHDAITNDAVAWCAAFAGACLERAGLRSTRSLLARSYLTWGEAVEEARYGAIAVLSRGFDPRLGHVGFLIGSTSADVILLGGNQGDTVSVQAYPRSRLLGLRWPAAAVSILPSPPPSPSAPAATTAPLQDASDIFSRALAHVLEMEGGYSDDPYDPGGPTNFGITLAVFSRDLGVPLTPENVTDLKAQLKRISPDTLRRIYLERYWLPACCPDLPPPVALFHFDAAVNQGVTGAARMLQQAIGTDIDGEIGPLTLAAVAAQPFAQTLATYAEIRRERYRGLAQFWRFGRGWLARIDRTLELADAIARAMPATVSPQQQEPKPMPADTPATTQPAPASDSKWWGQSMTIWGVIITTLSTVLPALSPVIGINVTADLIQQLGDSLVLFGQAAAALIGTVMTVYGRFRASTPLERRQLTLKM